MKIAHISDLHCRNKIPGSSGINSRRSRDMPRLFKLFLQTIEQERVDFIAVTGDLLDVPLYIISGDDYYNYKKRQFFKEILQDYKEIKKALDKTKIPYMVVPGNHDYEPLFWKVFDKEKNILKLQNHKFVRFCDREHSGHIPRRFDREKKLFIGELQKNDNLFQVHLQHYVIAPAIDSAYPHNYLEKDILQDAIKRSDRVALSLHGHYHPESEALTIGNTLFSIAPSFSEYPHQYRLYTLTDGAISDTQKKNFPDHRPLSGKKVIFLDRDGTINTLPCYNSGPEQMELIKGAAEAIKIFTSLGYAVVVVTSQSAVGAGYVLPETVYSVNDEMSRLLAQHKCTLDAIYFSFEAGEAAVEEVYKETGRSKPAITLLEQARDDLGISIEGSYFVGDSGVDIQTARNAGITPVLVKTGHGNETAQNTDMEGVQVFDDLLAFARQLV